MTNFSFALQSRIYTLKSTAIKGDCVLYVMSRDQRVRDNHALLIAQKQAISKKLPLVVAFCLYTTAGYRAREHYQFMLDGLSEVENELKKLNITLYFMVGEGESKIISLCEAISPVALFFDFNSLSGPRNMQKMVALKVDCSVYVVDTHNIVPVWVTSDKREIAARTIRPKLHRNFAIYLTPPDDLVEHPYTWSNQSNSINGSKKEINQVLEAVPQSGIVHGFTSGEKSANLALKEFIKDDLHEYAEKRNDPPIDALSNLSPYLHYGQLSSLRVALELQAEMGGENLHLLDSLKMPKAENYDDKKVAGADVLLEEMIVRKELSDNYCFYQSDYLSVSSADDWAQKTIKEHDNDPREHLYSYIELRDAKTHDPAWNAAQRQMTSSGKMHGYMRMYWCKKIKEWTENAEQAIDFAVRLNDHYSIDGGDSNGYAGIMWAICGLHDRAWNERDIFGKIRYMNYAGLKRKFDIEIYEKAHN